MKPSPTELQWPLEPREGGLRLSSAVLCFLLGLTLIVNPGIFEASPGYLSLRPYPEWCFGLTFWSLSAFQMLSRRGWARCSSLLLAAALWLFWSAFIYISTKAINTGSACYLGISLLTFYEFYLEIRGRGSLTRDKLYKGHV